jgi:hypothetical protein
MEEKLTMSENDPWYGVNKTVIVSELKNENEAIRNKLAALRAESAGRLDALNSWAKLWSHICTVTGCEDYLPSESNFDAMIDKAQTERISALEAAVEQARELLTTLDWNDWSDKVDEWLAAHHATEAHVSADDLAESELSNDELDYQDMLDEWRERL